MEPIQRAAPPAHQDRPNTSDAPGSPASQREVISREIARPQAAMEQSADQARGVLSVAGADDAGAILCEAAQHAQLVLRSQAQPYA